MNKNTQNKALVDALVFNNRFGNKSVNGEQITAEGLDAWKKLIEQLHRVSYKAYVVCENSGLKSESTDIDKTEIFDAIRQILATIGEVNSHKMYANAEMAIAVIGYSGKRGNKDEGDLQYCESRIKNLNAEIRLYEKLNVSDAEHKAKKLAKMNESLEALKAERKELLNTPDMRIKQPTRTKANAFRLEVEHYLARSITGQLAKSLEELDAEEAERKAKRAEAAKARKKNKTAKAETTAK